MPSTKDIFGQVGYKIVRTLAEGGMGIVYAAEQYGADDFCKQVAMKIIREEFSAIREFRANFNGEARLVADLIHTNIVQTYQLGLHQGQYYMVMELVNGRSLEDFFVYHLETEQQMPVNLAAFIVSRVSRGLAYAHQKRNKKGDLLGIVHRDVNPKNILISEEGDVKLTDFGIAKAADLMYNKEGEVIAGKDEYLSPEQALKEVTDSRADIFACGIILSELLLGYHIFECADPELTRRNIVEMKLPDFRKLRPDIDAELNAVIHKAMAKKREDRYQTANELLVALEQYLYGSSYGPTNDKLALYMRDLFGHDGVNASSRWETENTPGLV
jgi:eukaryotic-like serine/threonine-protein kinase